MQNLKNQNSSINLVNIKKSLLNFAGMLALSALVCSVSSISNVRADEQPEHAMHDMQGMDMKGMDMDHMENMDHMDHSMHMQMLSKKGSYTSSVMTYSVPDIKLLDINGKSVSLRELTNDQSPVLLNFIYTTCTTICPVMSATFQQIQEKLGTDRKDLRMVSVSIDPENDTPAKLKEYAIKFKAGPQWTLLTGTLDNSLSAQKAFGVFAGEKMNHKPITFLKAKGSDAQWVRLDGLAEADQIIGELDKVASGKKMHD